MGDLRLKAQNILKLKQKERENSLAELLSNKKYREKKEFQDKVKLEMDMFKFNLLESAKRGEPLTIDILEIEDNLFLNSDEMDIKRLTQYIPIKVRVATFLNETNFEFLTDDIIEDETLQSLYTLICESDIYPVWKTRASHDDKSGTVLYLEINPMLSFEERKEFLADKRDRRKELDTHAVVLYNQSIKKIKKSEKMEKLRDFVITFLLTLYISVLLLTLLASGLELFPLNEMKDTFSIVAFGWPYFIFTGFSSLFVVSFPFGVLFSFFITYILGRDKK